MKSGLNDFYGRGAGENGFRSGIRKSDQPPLKSYQFGVAALIFYFIIDFCRPQESFHFLMYIKPGMVASLMLMLFVYKNMALVDWKAPPLRLTIYILLLMIVLVPFAENIKRSYQITLLMFLILPLLISLILLITDEKKLDSFLHLQGVIVVYLAGYSLLHAGRGPGGFIGDENDVALHAVIGVPFFCYLYTCVVKKSEKIMAIVYLLAAVVIVVVSMSRGGFVGLSAVGIIYWWYSRHKGRIMLAIVSVLGVLLVLAGPEYWQDMATITDTKESTAQARILSWTAGWRMFIDNPWGVGAGSFNYLFPDYQPQEMSKNMWGRAAHSLWFTLLPELGVIGCVLYLRLIMTSYGGFLWLRKDSSRGAIVNKKEFELSTAIVASLTGFFAAASFVSVLYYPQFWILAVVIFCSKRVYQKEGAEKRIPG